MRMCKAFATKENAFLRGFARAIRCDANTWSKSLNDGYSLLEHNFSQWRAIVLLRMQQVVPDRPNRFAISKTFGRSRPITERRLALMPSASFRLHSREKLAR